MSETIENNLSPRAFPLEIGGGGGGGASSFYRKIPGNEVDYRIKLKKYQLLLALISKKRYNTLYQRDK